VGGLPGRLTWGVEAEQRSLRLQCLGGEVHTVFLHAANGLLFWDHDCGPESLAVEAMFLDHSEGLCGCYLLARWWQRKGVVWKRAFLDWSTNQIQVTFAVGSLASIAGDTVNSLTEVVTLESNEEGIALFVRIVRSTEKDPSFRWSNIVGQPQAGIKRTVPG
jgi:hypothetical protein